jgi:tetratricopeptide (TPR) repeat protein
MRSLSAARLTVLRVVGLLVLVGFLFPAPGATGQSLWDDPAFQLARQAQEALQRNDYPASVDLARRAIGEYPDHVWAHYLLAQAALAQRQWDEAVASLTTVIRLYPRSFAAHRELGVAQTQLGRPVEAMRAFEAALALRPDGPDAEDVKLRLAFLRLQGGDTAGAVPLLTALAEAGTTVPEVWTAIGRLRYEQDQLAESERAFRRAAELKDDGKTWFNLAVVRLRLYDKTGAIDAFQRAAVHPEVREQAVTELGKLGVKPSP